MMAERISRPSKFLTWLHDRVLGWKNAKLDGPWLEIIAFDLDNYRLSPKSTKHLYASLEDMLKTMNYFQTWSNLTRKLTSSSSSSNHTIALVTPTLNDKLVWSKRVEFSLSAQTAMNSMLHWLTLYPQTKSRAYPLTTLQSQINEGDIMTCKVHLHC